MALTTVPVELANLDGAVTVNESSADADFRVESNGSANMLFVDGGNDRVGINTNSPLVKFTVAGGAEGNPATSGTTQANASGRFFYGGASLDIGHYSSGTAWILNSAPSDLSTNRDIALQPNGGKVGIGIASPDTITHISGAGGTAVLRLENPDAGLSTNEVIGKIEFETQDSGGAGVNAYIQAAGANTSGAAYLSFGTGTGGSPSEGMRIDNAGHVTMPLQPAFNAYNSTDVSNLSANSAHTLVFNSERFDIGSNYNASTGYFTAPVTGKYQLSTTVRIDSIDPAASYNYVQIVTSNSSYYVIYDHGGTDVNYFSYSMSVLADMDAADTAHVSFYQANGSNVSDFLNAGANRFTGVLVA